MKTSKSTVAVSKMKKGFTLVELLFVMAVISILAGFGISKMSGSTDTAEDIKAKANVRNTINEAMLYYVEHKNFDNFDSSFENVIVGVATVADGNSRSGFCIQATGATKSYFYNSITENNGGSSNVSEGDCGFSIPSN
jgi:prepilin-type N-terminal cleavage/methylation domain-containing protein